MTDQTIAEEAVEAAAWVLAGADRHADIGTAWIDCARRVLAAAYPYLRRQIETGVRERIAREIEAVGAGDRSVQIGLIWKDAAAEIARGAAQSGGEQ